jgi:hypothetical protein
VNRKGAGSAHAASHLLFFSRESPPFRAVIDNILANNQSTIAADNLSHGIVFDEIAAITLGAAAGAYGNLLNAFFRQSFFS